MKIVPGFVIREVAGKSVAISLNPALSFHGMLSLNSTARFLWDRLSEGAEREDLYCALMEEYDIEREVAVRDVDAIVDMLISHGIVV